MLLQENIPLAPAHHLPPGRSRALLRRSEISTGSAGSGRVRALEELPLFVLGGGSNLVVADSGWPGLVLKVAIPGIDQRPGHKMKAKFFSTSARENPGTASSRTPSWRTARASSA